jgi:ABC-type maltose transport system permease subunit
MGIVPVRIAACMFLALPILVLFLFFKEKLMGNISMGGLKE